MELSDDTGPRQADETLPDMVRRAMKLKGLTTIKETAETAKVSTECIRLMLNRGHVPKDKTLRQIAERLGLDAVRMMVAAQKQIIPQLARENLLAPAAEIPFRKKRIWPLSQEQCEYLEKIMKPEEIQLIRKYRQVTPEAKIQIRGYVDYEFDAFHRSRPAVVQEMAGEEQNAGVGVM